ncbi:succinate dehydrogenase / fumarate reductase cytochrome b subunit [Lipingzhangella halophila]|uniref:Succinate dehydrogenase / fumarate reductase cytochrome b subunit n=1 Tax=Lipingzhangella halophila TaxID=1783352 RepID=A0A7W7W117_9ACTN|nr:succinate dehydrogenase cytochrome b subunit [Lipingzhangella halophila]MBB4929848.1 succinate dehydrogenase / fumarate reductase cytochrome b subunit [Lipingzhangella halophila]
MANIPLTKQRSAAFRSSVALKSAMAVTGAVLVLFLVAHMYGNLLIFGGQQAFDDYSHHLRELGEPMLPHGGALWIIRVVLLASVLVHAYAAVVLWARAARARPAGQRYAVRKSAQSPVRRYATQTMRWGGVIIVLFVVYHLLHLTTNDIAPGGASASPYERVVNGFSIWWVVLSYVVAVLAVGYHLWHGIWSALATLGANRAGRERALRTTAAAIATIITVGFLIPPFSILLGLVS